MSPTLRRPRNRAGLRRSGLVFSRAPSLEYSLGDLVFDWTHDERTQEGVVAVLTFAGGRLAQIVLQPTLIIAGQPNLLDRAGDGHAVLDPVRRSSAPLPGW
jgi:hypothetical protein